MWDGTGAESPAAIYCDATGNDGRECDPNIDPAKVTPSVDWGSFNCGVNQDCVESSQFAGDGYCLDLCQNTEGELYGAAGCCSGLVKDLYGGTDRCCPENTGTTYTALDVCAQPITCNDAFSVYGITACCHDALVVNGVALDAEIAISISYS